jgi:hypothetical protein
MQAQDEALTLWNEKIIPLLFAITPYSFLSKQRDPEGQGI